CQNGACVSAGCLPGFQDCDANPMNGCEASLNNDNNNCGGCGKRCMLANAMPICLVGMCSISSCNNGYKNCDGNIANGCETNVASDLNNCGGCGKVCMGMGQNAVAACVNGACSLSCNPGYGNCDGNLGNGCELDVRADPKNCGGCGIACPMNM